MHHANGPAARRRVSELPDVLCFLSVPWRSLFSRDRLLLSALASDRSVVVVEEPVATSGPPRMDYQIAAGVALATLRLPPGLGRVAALPGAAGLIDQLIVDAGLERFVLWHTSPASLPLTRHLRPTATVYDNVSASTPMTTLRGPARLPPEALSATLVFTDDAESAVEWRAQHGAVHLIPDDVDRARFAQARTKRPRRQRPVIGYFGVVDARLDLRLLAQLAAARPGWDLVLAGPLRLDGAPIPHAPNLSYRDPPYDDLPALVAGWDAVMLPLVQGRATRCPAPQQLAALDAGTPLVSTVEAGALYSPGSHFAAAEGAEGFILALEEQLRLADGGLAQPLTLRRASPPAWMRMKELIEAAAMAGLRALGEGDETPR